MQKIYRIYPAIVAPVIVTAAVVYFGIMFTPWAFVALPFVYLGSIGATPNLNLANGFFVLISMFLGAGVSLLKKEIGISILAGVTISWLLSAIEKAITAKPITDEKNGA
jgi:hypothetical protein